MKLKSDNSAGNWADCNRQVLPEQEVSEEQGIHPSPHCIRFEGSTAGKVL